MIARVSLDFAVKKEFDYLVPPELEVRVEVGSRVRVPFGPREVLGAVTALVEVSPHTNLRPIRQGPGGGSPAYSRSLKIGALDFRLLLLPV